MASNSGSGVTTLLRFWQRTKIAMVIGVSAHVGNCMAGATEVQAAYAMGFTLSMFEKCTGDAPAPAKLERITKRMMAAGMTPKDFGAGAGRAASEVESKYPGRARPPADLCEQALKTYNEAFGRM